MLRASFDAFWAKGGSFRPRSTCLPIAVTWTKSSFLLYHGLGHSKGGSLLRGNDGANLRFAPESLRQQSSRLFEHRCRPSREWNAIFLFKLTFSRLPQYRTSAYTVYPQITTRRPKPPVILPTPPSRTRLRRRTI